MPCLKTKHVILCTSSINYSCPYCEQDYEDIGDKLPERINKSKVGYTTQKCKFCGERFKISADYMSQLVTFK